MLDIPDENIEAKKKEWRDSPILFFVEVLGMKRENIWSKMEEMCFAVRDNRRVAVKAGHSVSKSYTSARILLWYLYCYCPCTVITTAPTQTQVEEILWREIREAHANARIKLGGNLTQTKLDLQDAVPGAMLKWFAFGFATRPDEVDGNATKIQGFHNENLLFIFDEADGILPPIWNAADGLLTNERAKFLAIGNPMKSAGNFVDCFKSELYKKITISVKDTPNYIEGREVIPGLSGRSYEEDMRKKWGEDSDMYRSRVLGEIPDSDADSIVPVSYYERAEGRKVYDVSRVIKRFLVVDVADGGNDDTVVKCWENKTQVNEFRFPGKRADEIYGDVWRICKEQKANTIIYDDDGCGRILGGLLRGVVSQDISIIAFNGSGAPQNDNDFYNRRAEGYFKMFLDFRDNKISIAKNNDRCKQDITSIKWGIPNKGKMIVEAKKDLRKRIGRSPDDGDCIMMMSACYDMVKAIGVKDMYVSKGTKKSKSWMAV